MFMASTKLSQHAMGMRMKRCMVPSILLMLALQAAVLVAGQGIGQATHDKEIKTILGTLLILVLLLCYFLAWCRWICVRNSFAHRIIGVKRFKYKVLAAATGKFSDEKRLGESSFSAVYRGDLTDKQGVKQTVAVKKIKNISRKNILAEIIAISETRHDNLVRLKGWCCNPTRMNIMCCSKPRNVKLFLVYELVSNSSLDYHLHRSAQDLPWPTRYQIMKGILSAVHNLHHICEPYILHRGLKSSNILLDDEFNTKLTNFGLSRLASRNAEKERYIDPQCRRNDGMANFGRHSDVYSFGIVLLEIACTDKSREDVLEIYSENAQSRVEAAADAKLNGVFDRKQMERVVVLGLRCSDPEGDKRPSMLDAMQFMENGIELPAVINKRGAQLELSITMPHGAGSSS